MLDEPLGDLIHSYYRGKKVLVTGGAGFVGSHLVENLVQLGAQVRVPVRASTSLDFLKEYRGSIETVPVDLFDRALSEGVFKNQQIVFHLAAAKGGGIAHSVKHHGSLFRDNMLSFINSIEAARLAAVERFVVVSSACVYARDVDVPIKEEEGFREVPEPTNAGYGWSKRMGEYLSLAYHEEFGMNVSVARPFNAYGPRDDFFASENHVIPGLIKRLLNGETPLVVWGSGQQTRSFLYVSDFVLGLLKLGAHEGVPGPINLGNEEEITIANLAKLLVSLGEELFGIKISLVFDSTKPDGQPRRSCDTQRAEREIGFKAQGSLREGLRKTLQWYEAERKRRAHV